jgi:uncharacterized protein YdeI (YjbR/CyaY-like superfamily)
MDCSRPRSKHPDDWIENCPAFSRPLCAELRESFARWEPDLSEAVKWNMLSYSGRRLVVALMGCKRHAGIIFFRGVELHDPDGLFSRGGDNAAMLTVRVERPDALDRDALRRLLRAAVALDGSDVPPLPPRKRPPLPTPGFFATALTRNRAAREGFARLSPSLRREYLVWLGTAKRPETRERRLRETLAALADGLAWPDRARSAR